jgi:hypothetical protein
LKNHYDTRINHSFYRRNSFTVMIFCFHEWNKEMYTMKNVFLFPIYLYGYWLDSFCFSRKRIKIIISKGQRPHIKIW